MVKKLRFTLPNLAAFLFIGLFVLCVPPIQAQGVGTLKIVVNCDTRDTLQAAVNKSREGTKIEVSGACNEHVDINKDRISLLGQPGATLSAPAGSFSIIGITGRNVEVRNFEINATGVEDGILIDRGGYAVIADNGVRNSEGDGISVLNGSFGEISDNDIIDNAVMGIFLFNGASARITGNTIENSGDLGIQLDGGVHALIGDNEIRKNGAGGIWIRINSGAWIRDNIIEANAENGIGVVESGSAQITANTITGNGISGVTVKRNASVEFPTWAGGANLIEGNEFYGVHCGASGSLNVDIAQDFGTGNAPANELIDLGCDN